MNSGSEMKLSLAELKQMNSRDLSAASEGERHITLTDRNWMAVLNILGRVSSQQLDLQTAVALLLTRPDVEELLNRINSSTQTQLQCLNSEVESFGQQAGNLNERFSCAAEKLVSNTEKELDSLTRSTKDSLDTMQRKTDSQIEELRRSTIRWIKVMGVVCIAAVMSLTILYFVTTLRRLG